MDDFDLDAILDETPVPDAGGGGVDDVEFDDSMLDDALDLVIEAENPAPATAVAEAEKPRASNDFGPSENWLNRQQGSGGYKKGQGKAGTVAGKEPWPFLSEERREAWKQAFAEDAQRQSDMEKQRPLSRAYCSFLPLKEEGAVVVHLGSGAAEKPGQGEGGEGHKDGEGKTGPGAKGVMRISGSDVAGMFEDIMERCVAKAEVEYAPPVGEDSVETMERLKASYVHLLANDVRARVASDPDMDPARFPGIAAKIIC